MIPKEAFREAIANELAHRTWDVRSNINVAMYDNRIEITSPGVLPKGISKEEYLNEEYPYLETIFYAMCF